MKQADTPHFIDPLVTGVGEQLHQAWYQIDSEKLRANFKTISPDAHLTTDVTLSRQAVKKICHALRGKSEKEKALFMGAISDLFRRPAEVCAHYARTLNQSETSPVKHEENLLTHLEALQDLLNLKELRTSRPSRSTTRNISHVVLDDLYRLGITDTTVASSYTVFLNLEGLHFEGLHTLEKENPKDYHRFTALVGGVMGSTSELVCSMLERGELLPIGKHQPIEEKRLNDLHVSQVSLLEWHLRIPRMQLT